MPSTSLPRTIARIADEAGATSIATACYDYHHRTGWSIHGDRLFHAASTIKVPIMVAVFEAIDRGLFTLDSRLHVRNRFLSAADGSPFRVGGSRDANAEVHDHLGRTMRIRELLRHMIMTSSNLATNLLVDLVGVEQIQSVMDAMEVEGIEFRRGVEDELAWEKKINNRVTADGLAMLLRRIAEGTAISEKASEEMLEILHGQEFRSGIPAGLPNEARVAHKTGEISTVAHDAGIVFLPGREPYVVVVLTEWEPSKGGRHAAIAKVSRAVYELMTDGDGEDAERDDDGDG